MVPYIFQRERVENPFKEGLDFKSAVSPRFQGEKGNKRYKDGKKNAPMNWFKYILFFSLCKPSISL